MWAVSLPPICFWHAKKDIIYSWIVLRWIVNLWIVYSSTRSQSSFATFRDKHISLRSISFMTTILLESSMTGYTPLWLKLKPITLLSKSIFTLIKKNLRDLVVGNDDFFTKLISCYYIGFIGLLSLL